MYYPYLRGRQNELLCLRELLENDILGDHIIPIIEPVRYSSTLFSTLSKFVDKKKNVILIKNPKVGSFYTERESLKLEISTTDNRKKEKIAKTIQTYDKIFNDSHIREAYLVNEEIINDILSSKLKVHDIVLINTNNDFLENYEEYADKLKAYLTVIPKNEEFNELFDDNDDNIVMLEDSFNKTKRNVDYLVNPDERFNKNYLTYTRYGYTGFSDYSIVGNIYEESGFAPSAIAIHIMYFGKKKELRIHHFVSSSNDEPVDHARKFAEAMENMLKWPNFYDIPKTRGLDSLINYYNIGKYPGLGVIKKYSLMHHIEMMNNCLEG